MLTFDLLAPGLTLLGAVALSVCSFWKREPLVWLLAAGGATLTLLLLLVKAGDAGVSTPAFVTGMMAFALAMGNLAMAVRWICTRKADAEDSNTFPQP